MSELSQGLTAPAPGSPEERLRTLEDLFGREWVKEFDDPVLFRSYTFNSKTATGFYLRNFAAMSRFLFAEVIYRRRPGFDDAMLNQFVEEVGKKLAEVQGLLVVNAQRQRKLCESNGQQADAAYVHPHHLLVPIIVPLATSYMRCLVKLDELFQLTGSATLCGVINSGDRKTIELTARRAMRLLHGLIRHEYTKLRTEAERLLTSPAMPEMSDEERVRIEDGQVQTVDHQDQHLDDDESGEPSPAATAMAPGRSEDHLQPVLPKADAQSETCGISASE